RKTQSVTSGENIRSSQPPSAVSAWAIASSVRTFVNGSSPSWRNWRRRKLTWARKEPGLECGIRGASLPGRDRLVTSILASGAPFAYLIFPQRLLEIHVPFVDVTAARYARPVLAAAFRRVWRTKPRSDQDTGTLRRLAEQTPILAAELGRALIVH